MSRECEACGHEYEPAPEQPFCAHCGERVDTEPEWHGECGCDECAEKATRSIPDWMGEV